ncbi:MAG: family metallo-hydrolase [Hydrocarboniphaga sp.]|uniref:M20/M25/M40 family metallo-hydrolase n=1 Tax=Hydrocarboniphaga sp. TaxID=2033016 RepID=UPI002638E232|nr:M20/M25/M40 family metallo-hydrolase [Hydrocarboniphaga sp.]MDB5968840.1 family metallo-hydrolase [Hydrocarboniphaga sp.]
MHLNRLLSPVAAVLLAAGSGGALAQTTSAADAPAVDIATLERIRDAAMSSDFAWQTLSNLADKVGPRLSGSAGAEAAVTQVSDAMKAAGLTVTLQPVKVPHWVRGEERAELVEYAGRPQGITQPLHLTALGGSSATPAKGLVAPVLIVHSVAELKTRAAEAKGRIVLISVAFDQNLADNGQSGQAYGQAGEPRFIGPAVAAGFGAAATLVRSVGGANYRLPHTGATKWEDGGKQIPAAALSAEDAMLIERLAAQGPVTMKLLLTPKTLPDADSHNVLADVPGRERPDEVVIVSGHLDSWDLGTGAMDDGMGVAAAMGAVQVLKSLGITPRRTVRAIAWMNEENGGRGGKAYFESVKDSIATQSAAIESDFGLAGPLGISGAISDAQMKLLAPVGMVLRGIGAGVQDTRGGEAGADIAPLQIAGVPGFAPLVDGRHYFDLHHTAADTLDKIDPQALRRQTAVLAVLAYYLAEMPQPLDRAPIEGR